MKSKLFRITSLFIGILLIAGLFFGAMTSKVVAGTPLQSDGDGNVSTLQAPGWTAATRVWTKEEMLAAEPYPLPFPAGQRVVGIAPEGPTGEPGFMPSSLPMDASPMTDVDADLGVFSSPSPLGYSYPAPFTRYNNFASYTSFPYVTIGKLFFTQYGVNYVCSASSIGNYAIWTAGHCVHYGNNDPAGWSYNVVFVPAYQNGTAPLGQWSAFKLWTNTGWFTSGDFRYDIGGAVLYPNASGYKISQVVGNLGFAWDQSVNLHWFQIGYPQAAPFDGQLMYINTSSFAYNDTSMGSPYPIGVGNDLTGGSSGGPWIYKFSGAAGSTNYLNGHNDYRYTTPSHPLEMFSPYFESAAHNLWSTLIAENPPAKLFSPMIRKR